MDTGARRERLIDPEPPLKILPTPEEVIQKYRSSIGIHIERRISFFFQQLAACYKTRLHFEIGDTLDQGASPDRIVLIDEAKKTLNFQRNAAHSSTIPCLIGYDYKKWQFYLLKIAP